MRFQFDPHQPYQASAIEAVTDLFDGQPADADQLVTTFRLLPSEPALFDQGEVSGQVSLDIAAEVGAVGNNLVLDEDMILANLQRVQDRNGLESAQALADGLQFDVERKPVRAKPTCICVPRLSWQSVTSLPSSSFWCRRWRSVRV